MSLVFGEDGGGGLQRRRDQPGVGRLEARLLLRQLGLVEEVLEQGLVGEVGPLEFAQLDAHVALAGAAGRRHHLAQGVLALLGDVVIVLQRRHEALRLGGKRGVQPLPLRADLRQRGIGVAVGHREVGLAPRDVGLLRPELHDDRRADDLGQRVEVAGAAPELGGLLEAGELLGRVGARQSQPLVEVGELLLAQRHLLVRGGGEAVLAAEVGHRLLGLAHLPAQAAEPVLEERRGLLDRAGVDLHLVGDIGLRHRVGEARRLARVARGHGDLQHVAFGDARHVDVAEQLGDDGRELGVDPVERRRLHRRRALRQKTLEDATQQAGRGAGRELGIVGEMLAPDHGRQRARREDDGDLRIHHSRIERRVRTRFLPEHALLGRVEQHLRGRHEGRRHAEAGEQREDARSSRGAADEFPATLEEPMDLAEIEAVEVLRLLVVVPHRHRLRVSHSGRRRRAKKA